MVVQRADGATGARARQCRYGVSAGSAEVWLRRAVMKRAKNNPAS